VLPNLWLLFIFPLFHEAACVSFLNPHITVHTAWVNSNWRWHDRRPLMTFKPFGMMTRPEEQRVMLPSIVSSNLIWPSNLLSNKCLKIFNKCGNLPSRTLWVVVHEARALCHSVPRSPRNNYEIPNIKQFRTLDIGFFLKSWSSARTRTPPFKEDLTIRTGTHYREKSCQNHWADLLGLVEMGHSEDPFSGWGRIIPHQLFC